MQSRLSYRSICITNKSTEILTRESVGTARKTMPVIEAEIVAFFEYDAQIDMPQSALLRLVEEGMQSPSCLPEFDEDDITHIAKFLHRASGHITNADNVGRAIIRLPHVFAPKNKIRLIGSINLTK